MLGSCFSPSAGPADGKTSRLARAVGRIGQCFSGSEQTSGQKYTEVGGSQ